MIKESAIFATIVLAGLSVFQLLLIVGLPLGKFAWGGSHKVLPTELRVGSFIAILLYTLFAVVILNKAGVISTFSNNRLIDIGIWIITVFLFIGTSMNALSPSIYEKYTMTPLTSILSILFMFVALQKK